MLRSAWLPRQRLSWESDFTGVRKTVTATEEEFGVLDKTLRQMARRDVPLPVGELAGIAEAAGQLGIQTPNIAEFVKVMAQVGTTTNLEAKDGATQLARFANVTQMSQGDFERLASSLVDLGNNYETTEAEIVSMSLRLAQSGNRLGLTNAEILGVATTLSAIGINAEAGGSAFMRVFDEMDKAIQTGGKELEVFGRVAGLSGGEFAGMFGSEGASTALVAFVNGLRDTIDRGENVHTILEELGFDNIRVRQALLGSANAGDHLNRTLATGTAAWGENVALAREAELRYGTTASQMVFAKNNINDLAITVGTTLVPALTTLLQKATPLIDWLNRMAEEHPTLVQNLALASVALLALGVTLIGVGIVAKAASVAIAGFQVAVKLARAAVWLWRNALLVTRVQNCCC